MVLSIFLLFLFSVHFCFVFDRNYKSAVNYQKNSPLKTNDQSITITTPENKVYSEAKEGYFLASYGFENELAGTVHAQWWVGESNSKGWTRIEDEVDGHKKVYRLYDWSGDDFSTITHTFQNRSSGTIEFWWRRTRLDCGGYIYLRNSDDQNVIVINADFDGTGQWQYQNESGTHRFLQSSYMNIDTWVHVRIDFELSGANYTGLVKDSLRLTVDGEEGLGYTFANKNNISKIILATRWGGYTHSFYVDAVGVSWDSNYTIGENRKEGLLLSFSSPFDLDWIRYSLDGKSNTTILGNTTIMMPKYGLHTIQVFANDTFGALHQSNVRQFTISPINIITPENRTYFKPMVGYYPATYGFENDQDGGIPEEWEDHSGAHPIITEVIPEFNGHKKVLRGYDGGTGAFHLRNYIYKSFGTVEWWWALSDVSTKEQQMIFLNNSDNVICGVRMRNSHLDFWDNNGWIINTSITTSDDVWYHCRIDFELTTSGYLGLGQGRYRCYFNETNFGEFTCGALNEVNYIRFYSGYPESDVYGYLDAVGYSWDPNYSIGDNLNDGLLLSFETSTTIDWKVFSLDNQPNRTILGNTTLVKPDDGLHSVQIFGNDSLGDIYESEIKYFTLNSYAMEIISPENKTYSERMWGYYPGTYGFEECADGLLPTGWSYYRWQHGSAQVVPSKIDVDGIEHKKVLGCFDSVSGDRYITVTGLFNQNRTSGTCEFWMLHNNFQPEYALHFGFRNTANQYTVYLQDYLNRFRYYNGTQILHTGVTFVSNKWYRISVDFSDDGSYANLSAHQYRFRIYDSDGKDLLYTSSDVNFQNNGASKDFHLRTEILSSSTVYFDAIGYSWDPKYNLGDNVNEGLILSYESLIELDKVYYSLDGGEKLLIYGNATISFPDYESHSIQLFGKDSTGYIYKSRIKQFNIIPIEITSPENKLYTKPMSGYYYASNSFDDPSLPVGSGAAGAQLLDEYLGHKNIVKMEDKWNNNYCLLSYKFTQIDQNDGTIEFWWATNETYMFGWGGIYIENVGATLGYLRFVEGRFWLGNDLTTEVHPVEIQNNKWYHIRIDWSRFGGYQGLGARKYKVTIDGVESTNLTFYNNQDIGASFLNIQTGYTDFDNVWYIDALGIGADLNYEIGDNLKQGLYLNYTTSVYFNWTGFSLDGQKNETIFGFTTIKMPEDGIHTIQMFLNDSIGNIYQSEIMYFLIDLSSPDIVLKFPHQNQFFGESAPTFNISVVDPHLNCTWYTIDNGQTNITFNSLTGTIDQEAWNEIPNGTTTLRFYANDTGGYIGLSEVIIRKDLIAPISSISFSPHIEKNLVNKSTLFLILADDDLGSGVLKIKYKINTSTSDSIWFDYDTPFDLSNYTSGDYLITFKAIDMVGNTEKANSILVRLVKLTATGQLNPISITIISTSLAGVAGFAGGVGMTIFFLKRKKRNSETSNFLS